MSSTTEPLSKLAESTAEAVTGVLEMFCPGQVEAGTVTLGEGNGDPLSDFAGPGVATYVSYTDGVTGGNVFAMSQGAARRLAAAMMGQEAPEGETDAELSELELSAVSEAMNQMMAAAATATGAVLGQEVEISPPRTMALGDPEAEPFEQTPHTISLPFELCGEPCLLVQLVPNAFMVRLSRALEEMGAEYAERGSPEAGAAFGVLAHSLADVPVRLWAELGRARMPAAQGVGLPGGTVLDLDREVDEPIDLYVNGLLFARGRLVVTDASDWAVQIEDVIGDHPG